MSEHLKQALEALHNLQGAAARVLARHDAGYQLDLRQLEIENRYAIETHTRLSKESASAIEGRAVTDEMVQAGCAAWTPGKDGSRYEKPMRRALEAALAMQPPQPTPGVSNVES